MIRKIALINLSKEPPKENYDFRLDIETVSRFLDVEIVYSRDFFAPIVGGDARTRALDLHRYIADDDIDMIWGYSGGSSANEILEYLDISHISRSRPLILAGFSDMTVLLHICHEHPLISSWHMPNFRTLLRGGYGVIESWSYLLERLRDRKDIHDLSFARRVFDYSALEELYPEQIVHHIGAMVLRHGYGVGDVLVGNVSTIDLLFGTKYEPRFAGKILCLEECSDMDIRSLRRVLFAWRQRGVFDQISGLVWGTPQVGMCPSAGSFSNFWDTIADVIRGYDFPVIGNALFGHISPQIPIANDDILTIDTYTGKYQIQLQKSISDIA